MIPLWISIAGGAGAASRFIVDGFVRAILGRRFPWGTLIINVLGAFLLGIVTGLTLYHHGSTDAKLIIGTGFCGGFTTFSTASFEAMRLIEERRMGSVAFQILGNIGFSLLAAVSGIWLTH